MLPLLLLHMDTYEETWQKARQQAEAQGLLIVETGWEQHVIIDEAKGLVARYPRHASAAAKLDDEVTVLKMLHKIDFDVLIPVMKEHLPTHSVYEYIPGDVLSDACLAKLSPDDFSDIGQGLGAFLATLHQAPPSLVEQKKTKQTMSLITYYSDRIRNSSPPSGIKGQALECLEKLHEYVSTEHLQVVVHGDLHGLNMVINPDTKKLVGIIDFSEVELGDPHQDLRKVYMTKTDLLDPAIRGYQRVSGHTLDREHIVMWALVNEWSNVCHFWGQDTQITYKRAYDNLQSWGYLG
jgi:aminoglycoside phosphotransferase (APT) family kinase protein